MGGIHNEIRRAARFLTGVQSAFGLDEDAGVERVSETLGVGFDLLRAPAEYQRLFGVKLIAARVTAAAVAAENSQVGVTNPANSRMLVVITGIQIRSTGGDTVQLWTRAALTTGLDSTGSFQPLDTRFPAGQTIANIRTTTTVGLALGAGAAWGFWLSADASGEQVLRLPVPVVLGPGNDLWIGRDTVNVALTAGFFGYERPALPRELVL